MRFIFTVHIYHEVRYKIEIYASYPQVLWLNYFCDAMLWRNVDILRVRHIQYFMQYAQIVCNKIHIYIAWQTTYQFTSTEYNSHQTEYTAYQYHNYHYYLSYLIAIDSTIFLTNKLQEMCAKSMVRISAQFYSQQSSDLTLYFRTLQ